MHCVLVIDDDSHKLQNIMNYNMTRGGVDMVDQMCNAYSTVCIQ
jgi:hypothetical protein